MTKKPNVTIGIPVLNEEKYIEGVINTFLNSDYPNLVEILIADGGSTDKTRDIILEISRKEEKVKLVENPERYQSFALNKMIDLAKGEIFLRADGHCIYANDYLSQCVSTLLESGARNVGGAQRYIAQNIVQSGIALAMKSHLGSGSAKYKREDFEGFADTVFLGCFWTKDLKEIGGFNETNITSQDLELNLRLKKKFGDAVYISPRIKSFYFPRSNLIKLFKQYFKHARGRFVTILLHTNDEYRGMFPSIFLVAVFSFAIVDLFSSVNLYSLHLLTLLFVVLMLESFRVTIKKFKYFKRNIWRGQGEGPGVFVLSYTVIVCLVAMLGGFFSGFMYQLFRNKILRIKGW